MNSYSIYLEDIFSFLEAVDIHPYKDCINVTYDRQGFLYEIPNYCIHMPVMFETKQIDNKSKPNEESINIIIRRGGDLINFAVLNTILVSELKQTICFKLKGGNFDMDFEPSRIRLFFWGKELHDNKELWFYNIEEESSILMMYKDD